MSTLESRPQPLVIAEGTACAVMNFTSLIGNSLVCLAVYRNASLRTPTNLYIIALALADLMSALVVMPLATGVLFEGRWIYGDVMCKIHGFVSLFVIYVSPATISLTAINRYVRIVQTNRYNALFSPRRSYVILVSVWLGIALYVLIPQLVGWQALGFVPGYAQCSIVHVTETGMLIHYCIVIGMLVCLPLLISTFSYYAVYEQIRQHNQSFIRPRAPSNGRISAQEIRLSKSLFVVVLTFLACWIPFWVIVLCKRFRKDQTMPRQLELLCMFFLYLSNTINPFIYAGMSRMFRREFGRIATCGRRSSRVIVQGFERRHQRSAFVLPTRRSKNKCDRPDEKGE